MYDQQDDGRAAEDHAGFQTDRAKALEYKAEKFRADREHDLDHRGDHVPEQSAEREHKSGDEQCDACVKACRTYALLTQQKEKQPANRAEDQARDLRSAGKAPANDGEGQRTLRFCSLKIGYFRKAAFHNQIGKRLNVVRLQRCVQYFAEFGLFSVRNAISSASSMRPVSVPLNRLSA